MRSCHYIKKLGAMFILDPEVILLTSMAVPMLAVSLIGKLSGV